MIKNIEQCYKDRKIVSFYSNKQDTNAHLTGYITCYNNDEILISHINTRGEYDGFILKFSNDIYKIDFDGEYEKKIEKLYQLKEEKHPSIKIDEESILFSLLDYAIEMSYIITLELKDNYVSGFIDEYNNNFIYIKIINEYGKESGKTIVDIDEVITFSCDTDDEQDLKLLFTNNYVDKRLK